VVAAGQAGSILNAVDAALVRGVTAQDTAGTIDARLLGPFRDFQLAEAKVAAQEKKDAPTPTEMLRSRLIVPTEPSWPRFFIAVATNANSSTPVLQVLTSPTARSPYGLWAQPALLPGATLPETASAAIGSPLVDPSAPGLVATPKEAIRGFAGYLNEGARTTASKQYRRSVYTDQLIRTLATDQKRLKAVATVTSKHTVLSTDPMAIRTSAGGALVIGELRQTYQVKVKKGLGRVKISDPELAALADGKKQFSTSFTRTADEVVVLNVPPRGNGLIRLIAAENGDIKAVAT
jgi:hypothetical protein